MSITKFSNSNSSWLVIFLIVILFKPTPTALLGAEVGMKIPDVLFLALMGFFILFRRRELRLNSITYFLLLVFLLEVFSQANGAVSGNSIITNDLVEFIRTIELIMAVLVGQALAISHQRYVFDRITLGIMLVFIVFSIFIFLDFLGSKSFASYFYEVGKSRGVSEVNVKNIWRLSSTFTNPNYFGFFSAAMSSLFLHLSLNKSKGWFVILFIVFFLFVVLSGSRTSLLAVVVLFPLLILGDFFFKGVRTKGRLLFLLSTIALAIFVIPLLVSFAAEFLWRFSNTENINESFGARLSAWQGASTSIVEHILVGVGSNKSEVASLDSNYVLILYKNGMLGLALYFALFVSVIYASFRKYIKYRWVDPYIEVVSVFCLSSTFIMFVAMITAIPLFMVQLSVPYFMLASYTISLKENPKEGLSAYV